MQKGHTGEIRENYEGHLLGNKGKIQTYFRKLHFPGFLLLWLTENTKKKAFIRFAVLARVAQNAEEERRRHADRQTDRHTDRKT